MATLGDLIKQFQNSNGDPFGSFSGHPCNNLQDNADAGNFYYTLILLLKVNYTMNKHGLK